MYRQWGKKLIDFIGATLLSVMLFPLLTFVGLLIKLRLGSPILFCQERTGQHSKSFTLYKFRTMTNATDARGQLLPDAQRLTPFGLFLRRSSLDELPSLFNVLRGDISLIGPRPLPVRYLERYSTAQARRHEVKPGITGWAQVNGRNMISWEEKFELDVWYVENISLLLDLKIMLLTTWKVLGQRGISQRGHATMAEFYGSLNANNTDKA